MNIETVLEELGVQLNSSSQREIAFWCPPGIHGHTTRKPTASINKISGLWTCYSCGAGGTLKILIEDLGGDGTTIVDLERERVAKAVKSKAESGPGEHESRSEPKRWISDRVLERYPYPPDKALAERYLERESAELFRCHWDADHAYWLLPVRSIDNELLGWQEKGKGHFKNVPYGMRKSRSLFGYELLVEEPAVLVESPLDAVRLHSAGVTNAVSSYGVEVSDYQMKALIDAVPTVILCLDNDDAGWKAARKLHQEWRRRIPMLFVNYEGTDAKDPGDEPRDGVVRRMIQNATTVPWMA